MLTLVVYLYETAFRNQIIGYGAALAWGIFIIILSVILLSVLLKSVISIVQGGNRR